MSREVKSSSTTTSRLGLMTVLGTGVGTAIGAVVGNMTLGIGAGAVLGFVVGGVLEILRWRKRARPN